MKSRSLISISVFFLGLLVFFISILPIALCALIGLEFKIGEWVILIGLVFSIISIFTIGSILKTKWLIWITNHSNNWHLIRRVAIKNYLISNSKFLKFFEIRYFVNNKKYIDSLNKIICSNFLITKNKKYRKKWPINTDFFVDPGLVVI